MERQLIAGHVCAFAQTAGSLVLLSSQAQKPSQTCERPGLHIQLLRFCQRKPLPRSADAHEPTRRLPAQLTSQ